MTPAQATLKTIVQCRPLWFWHVIGGALCLVALIRPMAFPAEREGAVIGVLVVPLWIGMICASLWRDVLDKPSSFLLPRHQLVWRRSLFTIALVVAAACTLVTLFAPAQTPAAIAGRAWQILTLGIALFMAIVVVTRLFSNTSVMPGLVTVLFFNSLDDGIATQLNASVERALLANALVTTVVQRGADGRLRQGS
jgi:MFS family permease